MEVHAGTVVLYSDVGCPWAHLAVHRFQQTRARLGLEDAVALDHRAFPLEIFNQRPTPKRTLDAEIPVAGGLEPGAGWEPWQREMHEWPVTTLPALEAVQSAKAQGLGAAESLDRGLRRAFFGQSRCISMQSEILDIASSIEGIDRGDLAARLERGAGRSAVFEQTRVAERSEAVTGSPHFFLADGSDYHNPGIEMHWEGPHGRGFPVIDKDRPNIYEELLERAIR